MKLTLINSIINKNVTIIKGTSMSVRKWAKLLGVSRAKIENDSRFAANVSVSPQQDYIRDCILNDPQLGRAKLKLVKMVMSRFNYGLRDAKHEVEKWFSENRPTETRY